MAAAFVLLFQLLADAAKAQNQKTPSSLASAHTPLPLPAPDAHPSPSSYGGRPDKPRYSPGTPYHGSAQSPAVFVSPSSQASAHEEAGPQSPSSEIGKRVSSPVTLPSVPKPSEKSEQPPLSLPSGAHKYGGPQASSVASGPDSAYIICRVVAEAGRKRLIVQSQVLLQNRCFVPFEVLVFPAVDAMGVGEGACTGASPATRAGTSGETGSGRKERARGDVEWGASEPESEKGTRLLVLPPGGSAAVPVNRKARARAHTHALRIRIAGHV